MNELKVTGKQDFMGKEIPVVLGGFGVGKKCISDKTIAEIHGMEIKHVRELINRNIARFKPGIDCLDLKVVVQNDDNLLDTLGYTKMQISKAEHIYILSERGYAKLIKIMDTDLAWEIHDNLMDEYFAMRDEKVIISELPPDMQYMNVLCQNMNRMYLEQRQQSEKMKQLESDVKQIEAKITTHNEDYYTVAGYASLRGINVDISKANMLGRKASKLSREYGYDISKIQDPRFGRVNTYHVDILKAVFGNIMQS